MKTTVTATICLLALGCSDAPTKHVADGGSGPDAAQTSELASTWILRRVSAEVTPDAGRDSGLTPVPRIAADGGLILPEEPAAPVDAGSPPAVDEEDAGSDEPAPCSSSNCLCGRVCERGLALECPGDESLEVCVEQCDVASSDCYEQLLRVLRCTVALPDAAYSCDPDFLAFVAEGCAAEQAALQTCRSF